MRPVSSTHGLAAALTAALATTPRAADRQLAIEWIDVLGGATLIVTPAGESIRRHRLARLRGPRRQADQGGARSPRRDGHRSPDHRTTTPTTTAVSRSWRRWCRSSASHDHGLMAALLEIATSARCRRLPRRGEGHDDHAFEPGDSIALKQGAVRSCR
jgi:hypothetical protein